MAEFKDFPLRLVDPFFNSPLTNLIIDLDALRKKRLFGTTKPIIFFQLKDIFHMLESLASARIEGNNTTVADYIETKIGKQTTAPETGFREILNMEMCLEFIDDTVSNSNIDRAFVCELHKMAVKDLPTGNSGEGDETPGLYRLKPLGIANSKHLPPESINVPIYMDELFKFIANAKDPKYDLLMVAIAHHRFVWIHPFNNGNGRTVRMLTYAMLVKYGFNVGESRILNPAAIFCSDRDDYYEKLSLADTGTDAGLLAWCEYVLKGLNGEIKKIDQLLEYDFLKKKILFPTLTLALEREWITDVEYKVLKRTVDKQIMQASDLSDIITSTHLSERTRVIRALKEQGMLVATPQNSRRYAICFKNNYLLRGIIELLMLEGFVPFR